MATDYDALVLRAETAANNAADSAEQAAADRQAVEQLTLTINNEQAVSIQNSKEEIRQAIVAKGQECDTSVAFADYADKILSITTEAGGVDTSNDTVTADSMLLGVTAHNAAGVQITGTIATSTPTIEDNLVTIPAGHIASDTTLTVDEAATATVSDNTVTINKGYTSKEYVVSVATAGAVVTDRNVVTVPKGWHDGSTVTLVSRSLPNISIAVDSDSGRVTASYTAEEGWHNAGTIDAAETLDVQAAQTYTPGTADITIPAYKFLTGAQTIKGEPNLIAENIPSDMNFFGIQGTREIGATGEGGSCKFYECSAVIEQSEGGVLVSGITDTNVYADDEINGLYTYGELTDCVATTGYTHEKGKMWIYKHPDYVFWLITQSKQAPDPGTSVAYCRGEANENPWELAYDWTLNSGSGEVVVEQAPPADASWTGYEWNLVEKEIASEPVFDYSFILFGGPNAKAFSGEYKPTDATKDKTGTEIVYTAGDNKFCFCNPALGYWVLSTDGSSASEFRTNSDSLTNPWDAGRSGWYNQEAGNIDSKIYAQTPAAVTGYIVSANENSTLPSSTYDYGMYTDSGETSDGVPVYTNDVGQKLYRITFESYGTYWCVFNTVTTPNNMESTYTYVESTSDTPPDTIGAVTVQPYAAPEASDPEVIKVYEKSSTITEGLSWTSVKPKVGKSYTEDALVEVASLYQVIDEESSSSSSSSSGEVEDSSSSSSSSSDSSSTDTPSGNIAFTVTHTNAVSVDFTGNYCDTGVQYQNQVAYIHEEDDDKTGTTPVRFALYNEGKWGFYKDPFYYISGGDFASLYFYANSSSNSPIGLTYVDNLGGHGTLNVSSYGGGSTDSSSSSSSSESTGDAEAVVYPDKISVSGTTGSGVWNVDGVYTKTDTLNDDKPTYENEYKSNQYIKYSDGYWRIYSYDAVSSECLYTCQTEGELDLSVTWTGNDAHISGSATVAEYTDSDEDASDVVFSVTGVESPENLNGTYTLVSGVASIKGSCRWENGAGGVVSPYNGNGTVFWMMWNSSDSEPSNPGMARFYNGDDGMPWEGSWETSYGTGTAVVTHGSGSNGGSTGTESDVLVVSGAYGEGNDIDGEYTLKDTTATGTNRVWTNGTYDIFYLSNGVDSMPSWILAPASAHQSYDYYIYNSPENITNDDGSSRTWNYQSSACSLKVTKKMSSDDTQTTGYTTFTVGGVSSFSGVNTTYTKVSGEGRTAVYSAPDASGYGSSWKVHVRTYNEVDRWVIEDGDSKSVVVVYATANLDAEHPWEVTEWYDDNDFSAPTVTFTNLA